MTNIAQRFPNILFLLNREQRSRVRRRHFPIPATTTTTPTPTATSGTSGDRNRISVVSKKKAGRDNMADEGQRVGGVSLPPRRRRGLGPARVELREEQAFEGHVRDFAVRDLVDEVC